MGGQSALAGSPGALVPTSAERTRPWGAPGRHSKSGHARRPRAHPQAAWYARASSGGKSSRSSARRTVPPSARRRSATGFARTVASG